MLLENNLSEGGHSITSKLKPYGLWVFCAQIVLIYIVVITSIVNLSLENGQGQLWTALLASSLGSLLPTPHLKLKRQQHTNGNGN